MVVGSALVCSLCQKSLASKDEVFVLHEDYDEMRVDEVSISVAEAKVNQDGLKVLCSQECAGFAVEDTLNQGKAAPVLGNDAEKSMQYVEDSGDAQPKTGEEPGNENFVENLDYEEEGDSEAEREENQVGMQDERKSCDVCKVASLDQDEFSAHVETKEHKENMSNYHMKQAAAAAEKTRPQNGGYGIGSDGEGLNLRNRRSKGAPLRRTNSEARLDAFGPRLKNVCRFCGQRYVGLKEHMTMSYKCRLQRSLLHDMETGNDQELKRFGRMLVNSEKHGDRKRRRDSPMVTDRSGSDNDEPMASHEVKEDRISPEVQVAAMKASEAVFNDLLKNAENDLAEANKSIEEIRLQLRIHEDMSVLQSKCNASSTAPSDQQRKLVEVYFEKPIEKESHLKRQKEIEAKIKALEQTVEEKRTQVLALGSVRRRTEVFAMRKKRTKDRKFEEGEYRIPRRAESHDEKSSGEPPSNVKRSSMRGKRVYKRARAGGETDGDKSGREKNHAEVCHHFKDRGSCMFGVDCRFVHHEPHGTYTLRGLSYEERQRKLHPTKEMNGDL